MLKCTMDLRRRWGLWDVYSMRYVLQGPLGLVHLVVYPSIFPKPSVPVDFGKHADDEMIGIILFWDG